MKNFVLGLIALAAISAPALANERTDIDPRDRGGYTATVVESAGAYAQGGFVRNFDRLNANSAKNELSDH